jgi:hypothetical protein
VWFSHRVTSFLNRCVRQRQKILLRHASNEKSTIKEMYENMGFDLIAFIHHDWTNYCFTYQGQSSDAPSKSITIRLRLRLPHFVQIFDNVYFLLAFLFLESLNDLHINTISLQQGYSKDIAIYIDEYGRYETILFCLIQWLYQSSKSHLHFRISK